MRIANPVTGRMQVVYVDRPNTEVELTPVAFELYEAAAKVNGGNCGWFRLSGAAHALYLEALLVETIRTTDQLATVLETAAEQADWLGI